MKKINRVFLIVLDSLGIGNADDAHLYNDAGANTFGHICDHMENFNIPTLTKLGIGNLGHFKNIPVSNHKNTYSAILKEKSNGKDTMTGHWEMMGLEVKVPFMTFTETGFPDEFIKLFEEKTGRKCVGNYAESGTKILDDLGEHHIKTGDWIVYTSADSVFQIAAHEDVVPLEELYNACVIARELAFDPKWKVGRIIARPFIGDKEGNFSRTPNRHDWALEPFSDTVLDELDHNGYDVIGIGKIPDIFVNKGINKSIHTVSNDDGMEKLINLTKMDFKGLAFLNLVDFDAKFGHRRNIKGYAEAIEDFDKQLNQLLPLLKEDDLLMISADHGNDPSYKGTDHTRENVPLLIYSKQFNDGKYLGTFDTFSYIGATIADIFNVNKPDIGESLLELLK